MAEQRRNADELVESFRKDRPELAVLFEAMRLEFDAKLQATQSRLLVRILAMGIPLGAIGGFAAELVKPGTTAEALGLLPWL